MFGARLDSARDWWRQAIGIWTREVRLKALISMIDGDLLRDVGTWLPLDWKAWC